MKKILVLIIFVFVLSTNLVLASGTIKLINFQEKLNQTVGYSFSVPINFLYSGSHSNQLGASVISSDESSLPSGVSLGSINQGTNGVNSVYLSGQPTMAGNYSLILVITDNDGGAMITQPFSLKITQNNFTLPNAEVSKSYFQSIPLGNYNDEALASFSVWKDGMESYDAVFSYIKSSVHNGATTVQLTPYKIGEYTLKVDIIVNNLVVNTEMFKLNVVKSSNLENIVAVPVQTNKEEISSKDIKQNIQTVKKVEDQMVPRKEIEKENIVPKKDVNIKDDQQAKIKEIKIENTNMQIIPVANTEKPQKLKWYQKIFNWFK